jgi:uncharacterized protein (TIGR00251 family)
MQLKNYLKIDWNYWYLQLKLTPWANKNEFFSILDDGTLKVRIKAPAEKWKANKELVKFISKDLNVLKSSIEIISGASDQRKIIRIKI